MGITEITREAILDAIAEHDRLGPDEFREKYGFGRARVYVLAHRGREYDSKAIVGVAHGHLPGHQALKPDDFSGGQETVVSLLEDRGFKVRELRSPPWLEAELILACDEVARNHWNAIRAHDQRAIELSELLQSHLLHPAEVRGATFRNPNSVQRKTFDIATQHPAYSGKTTKGGKLDREVLNAFLVSPVEMHAQAEEIRALIQSGELATLPAAADPDEEEAISEGRMLLVRHLRRERNPALRKKKINAVVAKSGCLECEVCSFDFEEFYGERGLRYAEVHHLTPLHASGPTTTQLKDLAILCSNCHRMIHRGQHWLSPAELRDLVLARRAKRAAATSST